MKKIIMIVALLLAVTGCSQTSVEEQGKNPVEQQEAEKSLKIDESKEYLYVANSVSIDLSEDQKKSVKEGHDVVETLTVNLNSEDAKKVNKTLAQQAKEAEQAMQKDEQGIQQFTSLTGTCIESSKYITVLTISSPFIWQSEMIPETYTAYMFSKEDGVLVSQETMLKALDLDDEAVLAKMRTYLKENEFTICEDMPGDCYYEPKIYRDDENFPDTVMYLNEKDQLTVYIQKSMGHSYEWEPIILA